MHRTAQHKHPPQTMEPRDPQWQEKVRDSFARQKVMALIGAELVDVQPGRCEIHLPFRADLTQQNDYFHAGIVSTVVDSAGGYAGFSLMPAGSDVLTVEYKLNLLAPGDGDRLIAIGEVVKPGRNLVITRGEVYAVKNGRSIHCATMQQTLMTMHGLRKAEEKKS
ncbi:MAG: PaaI family thioesterase [Rhodocyclaceae bacterium]|nr:MAG: PaaI family thioesterase [Rhodocyclaceae bacterium]